MRYKLKAISGAEISKSGTYLEPDIQSFAKKAGSEVETVMKDAKGLFHGENGQFVSLKKAQEASEAGKLVDEFGNAIKLPNSIETVKFNTKSNTKSEQLHHFATNKNKTYTPQFEKIAEKYGLDLDDFWNKEYMPHQGRHPNEYHDYVLERMIQYDKIAQGDKGVFLNLYEQMKKEVTNNPSVLYKDYWIKGDH